MSRSSACRRPVSLSVTPLEDRLAPSATVDLSQRGASGTINGAVYAQFDARPTAELQPFVTIKGSAARGNTQQGYNTDARPVQFDERTKPTLTHSLKLSDVPVVSVGGVASYQFVLDISQSPRHPFLSLDDVKIYVGDRPNLHGFSAKTGKLAGLSPVYNMDAGGNHWVKLNAALNAGSHGTGGDMLLEVPVSFFGQTTASSYVYLYSKFGVHYQANAGDQQWDTRPSAAVTTGSITGTLADTAGTPLAGWFVYLDTNGDGQWNPGESYVTTNTGGVYTLPNLPAGSYTLGFANQVDANGNLILVDYQQVSGTNDITLNPGENLTGADFTFLLRPH